MHFEHIPETLQLDYIAVDAKSYNEHIARMSASARGAFRQTSACIR